MEETVERVTERHGGKAAPVKHLYRRQYQISRGGYLDLEEIKTTRSLSRERDWVAPIMELKREHLYKCRSRACSGVSSAAGKRVPRRFPPAVLPWALEGPDDVEQEKRRGAIVPMPTVCVYQGRRADCH